MADYPARLGNPTVLPTKGMVVAARKASPLIICVALALAALLSITAQADTRAAQMSAEDKLNWAVDRLEILEMLNGYPYPINLRRLSDWAAHFTEDADFRIIEPGSDPLVLKGRKAIHDYEVALGNDRPDPIHEFGERKDHGEIPRRHYLTNIVIRSQTAENAKAGAYLMITSSEEGPPMRIYVTGRYEFKLKKIHRRWQIVDWVCYLDRNVGLHQRMIDAGIR